MSSIEKYNNAFVEGLSVEVDDTSALVRGVASKWDSIGHMSLMSIIEEDFEIELDPEDIMQFSSYEKGMEILKKYGIEF